MSIKLTALAYVKNTGGGARKEHFIEDHEPVGEMLWEEFFEQKGFITINAAGNIFLTEAGAKALEADTP